MFTCFVDVMGQGLAFPIFAALLMQPNRGFFASGSSPVVEPYWPGMWIHFRSETSRGVESDSALIKVRGDHRGIDFPVKNISADQFGWWTLGMSLSPDGQIHYFEDVLS